MEEIPLLILLVLLSAFFSGSEMALFSLSEARLKSLADQPGHIARQIKRALQLKKNPEKLLVTILIGNTLVNIGAAALATEVAVREFGDSGVTVATIAMTLIILVAAEILPKSFAQRNAETIARLVGTPLTLISYMVTPISFTLESMARFVNKITGGKGTMDQVSEEEIKAMVFMGSESGNVEADEREMIENIFTLNDVTAEDVMTQANDVVMISINQQVKDSIRIMVETGFSRFPVYAGNIDNIEGIVYTKDVMTDLIRKGNKMEKINLRELLKPAIFIPEQKPLDDLLRSFQKERKHVAIVVNEFGETRGLVTLEDILENIVGEISDEQDEEDRAIRRINNKTVLVDADVHILDIEETLRTKISEHVHKSIAWLILETLGDVPAKGDEVTINNVKCIIEEAEARKIKRVKLIKIR